MGRRQQSVRGIWVLVALMIVALITLIGFITTRLTARGSTAPTGTADRTSITQPPLPPPTANRPTTESIQPTPIPAALSAPPTPNQSAPTSPSAESAAALAAHGLERERADRDFAGAMTDYDAAIAHDPMYAPAYYLRAALHFKLGETAAAQQDYDRAIQLDSTSSQALYHRGRVEIERGNDTAALEYFDQALQRDPTNAQAYYTRGVFLPGVVRLSMRSMILLPRSRPIQR